MATNTTKLGLIKPDFVDVVDITDLNTNADDIDAAVGFTICTSSTRPSTPWTGQSIFETDTESSFIWDGSTWKPGGGGGSIEISATAPSSPAQGDLWWDSDNGNLYIYYDDGNSQQWVAANGPQVFVGTTAPPGYQGQLWFDSTQGKTYIYYDDGTSAQWVSAIGGSIAGSVVQVVSTIFTGVQTASVLAGGNVAVTDLSITHTLQNPSNRLIIMAYFGVAGSSATVGQVGIAVAQDGTLIGVGDTAGSRSRVAAGGQVSATGSAGVVTMPHIHLVHSPGDTASHTYTVRAININTGTITLYVNRSELDTDFASLPRGASALTLMEVAG